MSKVSANFRPTHLSYGEFARDFREHKIPLDVSLDDILGDPEYWMHVVSVLKVGTIIEVSNGDFTIDADLRVVAIDPYGQWAEVVQRGKPRTLNLGGSSASKDGKIVVDQDKVRGWFIMRGRDELARNLPDREAAMKRAAELEAVARR
jgi:hypothetical protein